MNTYQLKIFWSLSQFSIVHFSDKRPENMTLIQSKSEGIGRQIQRSHLLNYNFWELS